MASLDTSIREAFHDRGHTNYSYGSEEPVTPSIYMEIPIDNVFELPVMAFSAFRKMLSERPECNALIARLYSKGRQSSYKSLEAVMKDVLNSAFRYSLCKITVSDTQDIYYGTMGTLFNCHLAPIMMMSWIFERVVREDGKTSYHYRMPLIRISPRVIAEKDDSVKRFISNKFLSTVADMTLFSLPSFWNCTAIERDNLISHPNIRIEIDKCPFQIKTPCVPSIAVTNDSLLKIAADNIDDIIG